MKVIKKDITFPVDVDKTLIMEVGPNDPNYYRALKFNYYGKEKRAFPMQGNIDILIASVARGRNVIVWSGNGHEWAAEVLSTLNLDFLKVLVMSKPAGYLDDAECQTWMGSRIHEPLQDLK